MLNTRDLAFAKDRPLEPDVQLGRYYNYDFFI
jgi:hypothetical protein